MTQIILARENHKLYKKNINSKLNKMENDRDNDRGIINTYNDNNENTKKEKDKELKELIFQESTGSQNNHDKIYTENVSKNKTIVNNENFDKSLKKENFTKTNENQINNTEPDNDMQASKMNSTIKIEIEHLDDEIKELQNKLKSMINANKN